MGLVVRGLFALGAVLAGTGYAVNAVKSDGQANTAAPLIIGGALVGLGLYLGRR